MPKGTRRPSEVTYVEYSRTGGGYYHSRGQRSQSETGARHAQRVGGDTGMAKARAGARTIESTGNRVGYSTSNRSERTASKSAYPSRPSGTSGSQGVAKSAVTPPRAGRGADMTRYKGRTIGSVASRAYTAGTRRVK